MQEKKELTLNSEAELLKEVWKIMLSVESLTLQELTEKLQEITGKGNTACFYIIKILCKPIQIGWRMKGTAPEVTFVDPLLVEIPALDRKVHYALYSYWRDFVGMESDVFAKAKQFYN